MSESTDPIGQAMNRRRKIASEAAKQVGAHYLRGACGATPGEKNDGAAYRPGHVGWVEPEIDDPAKAMVCAAYSHISEVHVCSGGYAMITGGRPYSPSDEDLARYLSSLQQHRDSGRHQSQWPNYVGFTPRTANWKTPSGITSQRVWGQDCTDVRHFDCIGLVAWALEKAVSPQLAIQRSIPMYISATRERDKKKPWPGDIVTIEEHHIGIIIDQDWVVNATSGPYGVKKERYDHTKWTRVGRFPDADLFK
jgi:hypothetical protein